MGGEQGAGKDVSAQGLTRHMVDRVLGETSVASPDMDAFAKGDQVSDSTLESIKQMIQRAGAARALVLSIDEGQRWWSTGKFRAAGRRPRRIRAGTGARMGAIGPATFDGALIPVGVTTSLPRANFQQMGLIHRYLSEGVWQLLTDVWFFGFLLRQSLRPPGSDQRKPRLVSHHTVQPL